MVAGATIDPQGQVKYLEVILALLFNGGHSFKGSLTKTSECSEWLDLIGGLSPD